MIKKKSAKNKQVFITGASGKIGQNLLKKLLKQRYKVVALTRNRSNLTIKHRNLKIIKADLLEIEKYSKEIKKCDYVYHLAAYQEIADPNQNEFIQINVEGTRLILDELINSRIKKFIYVSTIMVFKPARRKRITEESPKRTTGNGNYYVETKLSALRLINNYQQKVPIITLYPTIVINPDEITDTNNSAKDGLLGFCWRTFGGGIPGGLMSTIGNKNRIMNYVLLDNLTIAMVAAITKGKEGNDYILGGENITVGNYLKKALKIKGKKVLPLRFPLFLLKIITLFKIKKLRIINSIAKNPPESIYVSSQKASRELDLKVNGIEDL